MTTKTHKKRWDMTFFDKIKSGLRKTLDNVAFTFSSEKLDDEFFEELEEKLIASDSGYETASAIVETLRKRVKELLITDAGQAKEQLILIVSDMLKSQSEANYSGKPAVILLIGVNGAGKTTTAGKLANIFRQSGRTVLIGAADTFRAAAVDQLEVWARRSGAEIISGANDPSAVVFDTVSAAKSRGTDIVICDTAGRLHTKKNLMEELSKMSRTIYKAAPEASVETLLVLDAVTGQNALNQAAQFAAGAGVSGIVLTKLDGTAKGGSVIAVKEKIGIPVRYVGVGEKIDDLMEFSPEEFTRALFS